VLVGVFLAALIECTTGLAWSRSNLRCLNGGLIIDFAFLFIFLNFM
jgi:hypothetical protein